MFVPLTVVEVKFRCCQHLSTGGRISKSFRGMIGKLLPTTTYLKTRQESVLFQEVQKLETDLHSQSEPKGP